MFLGLLPRKCALGLAAVFRAFVHLSFKCFMCGMKDSLRSKITPRNLVSSTTGTGVPFSSKVGSGWGLRNLQKCMHTVYRFRGRELESIGVSPVTERRNVS